MLVAFEVMLPIEDEEVLVRRNRDVLVLVEEEEVNIVQDEPEVSDVMVDIDVIILMHDEVDDLHQVVLNQNIVSKVHYGLDEFEYKVI